MARGVAMFLVIVGHALEIGFNPYFRSEGLYDGRAFELWRLIYSFHVPVFFFISGLLVPSASGRNLDKVLKSAVALILLIYATEAIFGSFGRLIHYRGDVVPVGTELIETIASGHTFYLAVTWFLFSIAIVQVVAYFFCKSTLYGKVLIGGLSVTVFVVSRVFDLQFMQMHTWPLGLFFFLIGSALSKRVQQVLQTGRRYAVGLLLVGIAGIALYRFNDGCFFDPTAVCNLYGKPAFVVLIVSGLTGFIPFFLATAFGGMAVIFGFCLLMQRTLLERPLVIIGQNTLVLLVVNGVFFRFVQFGMDKVFRAELWWLSAILSVVIQLGALKLSVVLTLPPIRLCQRLADLIVSAIVKPKAVSAP